MAETLKKGTRVTGVDRSKLATTLGKRYDSGESIRSLAASTGRSYGFVHRILTETEGPGGGFLDDGSAFGVYSRLNLYAASMRAIRLTAHD